VKWLRNGLEEKFLKYENYYLQTPATTRKVMKRNKPAQTPVRPNTGAATSTKTEEIRETSTYNHKWGAEKEKGTSYNTLITKETRTNHRVGSKAKV
jgi:hypothetical protein